MDELGIANVNRAPKLEKIVVNMGLGEAVSDAKVIDSALRDLAVVTAQKPAVRKAKISVAGFKLREGMTVGCKVTLRGARMWEFFDRLVAIALPRIRDFRGLSPRGFDGRGNYNFGVDDQTIFPEIEYDKVDRTLGMNITIVTSAPNDDEGHALLKALGFPFQARQQ